MFLWASVLIIQVIVMWDFDQFPFYCRIAAIINYYRDARLGYNVKSINVATADFVFAFRLSIFYGAFIVCVFIIKRNLWMLSVCGGVPFL